MGEEEAIEPQQAGQAGAQSGDLHPMEALLREGYDVRVLHRGQIVEGVIVQVGPSDVLIDVGAKSEGILHTRELERLGPEGLAALHEGRPVLVYVVTPEDRNGIPVLSLSRAQAERDWREAERLRESGEIFEGTATEYNKGGLIVRFGKVRGFVPASQIVSLERKRHGPEGEDPLAGLVGTRMQLKVIDINRSRNRLVLSERAAVREQRKQRREMLLAELQEGDVRKGKVVSIRDYGAFVDLDGADGLLHVSELAWHRVSHPSDVVEVGDEIEVYVLKMDRERRRIGLSLKRLQPDGWSLIADRYRVGQLVKGKITGLTRFGAFAHILGDDIEGLIHLSELSEEHISHPREVVQEGDVRTLRIIRIDLDRHRIDLSLKRVESAEHEDVDTDRAHERDRAESDDARRGSTSGLPDSGEPGPDPLQRGDAAPHCRLPGSVFAAEVVTLDPHVRPGKNRLPGQGWGRKDTVTKRLVFLYDSTVEPWHVDLQAMRERLGELQANGIKCEQMDTKDMSQDQLQSWRGEAYVPSVHHHLRIRKVFGSGRRGGLSELGKHVPALLVYDEGEDAPAAVYPHSKKRGHEIADFTIEGFLEELLNVSEE